MKYGWEQFNRTKEWLARDKRERLALTERLDISTEKAAALEKVRPEAEQGWQERRRSAARIAFNRGRMGGARRSDARPGGGLWVQNVVAGWLHDRGIWRDRQIVDHEQAVEREREARLGDRSVDLEKALPAAEDRAYTELGRVRSAAQKELRGRQGEADQAREVIKEREAAQERERETESQVERQSERRGYGHSMGR